MGAKQANNRREARVATDAKASARIALGIELIEISCNGARARVSIPLPIGTVVRLGLGRDRVRHARVAWSAEGIAGLEFLAPLAPEEVASFASVS
jgi:hypothetical protein